MNLKNKKILLKKFADEVEKEVDAELSSLEKSVPGVDKYLKSDTRFMPFVKDDLPDGMVSLKDALRPLSFALGPITGTAVQLGAAYIDPMLVERHLSNDKEFRGQAQQFTKLTALGEVTAKVTSSLDNIFQKLSYIPNFGDPYTAALSTFGAAYEATKSVLAGDITMAVVNLVGCAPFGSVSFKWAEKLFVSAKSSGTLKAFLKSSATFAGIKAGIKSTFSNGIEAIKDVAKQKIFASSFKDSMIASFRSLGESFKSLKSITKDFAKMVGSAAFNIFMHGPVIEGAYKGYTEKDRLEAAEKHKRAIRERCEAELNSEIDEMSDLCVQELEEQAKELFEQEEEERLK